MASKVSYWVTSEIAVPALRLCLEKIGNVLKRLASYFDWQQEGD